MKITNYKESFSLICIKFFFINSFSPTVTFSAVIILEFVERDKKILRLLRTERVMCGQWSFGEAVRKINNL